MSHGWPLPGSPMSRVKFNDAYQLTIHVPCVIHDLYVIGFLHIIKTIRPTISNDDRYSIHIILIMC